MIGPSLRAFCGLHLAKPGLNRRQGAPVIIDTVIFVSKRLQRVALAILCLITAQLVLASCEPEPSAMAARVSLDGR